MVLLPSGPPELLVSVDYKGSFWEDQRAEQAGEGSSSSAWRRLGSASEDSSSGSGSSLKLKKLKTKWQQHCSSGASNQQGCPSSTEPPVMKESSLDFNVQLERQFIGGQTASPPQVHS